MSIDKTNKRLIVIVILVFLSLGLLYFIYSVGVRICLNKYNNFQWKEYVSYWEQTKKHAEPVILCKNSLKQDLKKLEPYYIASISNDDSSKTNEQKYYEIIYKTLKNVVEGLESEVSYYEQDQPELQGGLFFYTNSSYEPITPSYFIKRKKKTVETLAYYKDRFMNYEANKLDKLYCPKLENIDVMYPMKKELCTELMTYYIKRSTPPSRDNFDFDVEYQKELNNFNKSIETQLKYCDNPNIHMYPFSSSNVRESRFIFSEIHW